MDELELLKMEKKMLNTVLGVLDRDIILKELTLKMRGEYYKNDNI